MTNQWNLLLSEYCNKGIITDTNLMLVYIVGIYDRDYIPRFKRTDIYTDDFENIHSVLNCFRKKIVTCHILAELSNFSMQIHNHRLANYFSFFVQALREADEEHLDKDSILDHCLLPKIGVTDLGIIEAAKRYECLIFTDDFPLAGYAQKMHLGVLNLNHIRTIEWKY